MLSFPTFNSQFCQAYPILIRDKRLGVAPRCPSLFIFSAVLIPEVDVFLTAYAIYICHSFRVLNTHPSVFTRDCNLYPIVYEVAFISLLFYHGLCHSKERHIYTFGKRRIQKCERYQFLDSLLKSSAALTGILCPILSLACHVCFGCVAKIFPCTFRL